jgi:hypothetical protein
MIEVFPDRRERLFGRMADIHRFTDRARQPGLTAVAARPLMGKTWTLTEVARLLLDEGPVSGRLSRIEGIRDQSSAVRGIRPVCPLAGR